MRFGLVFLFLRRSQWRTGTHQVPELAVRPRHLALRFAVCDVAVLIAREVIAEFFRRSKLLAALAFVTVHGVLLSYHYDLLSKNQQ